MKTRFLLLSLLSLSTAMLIACTGSGGYYKNDGPPSGSLSFSNAADAVPRYEKPHSGANKPYRINGKRYTPITGDQPMTQVGVASWYGKKFHGNKTSTGEIYNMYAMSAAHKTMELPSYAKVTNLANGHSVIVRVNDRGPFVDNRIIDLSYAAASKLGYVDKGTARVKVERIRMADIKAGRVPTSSSRFKLIEPDDAQKLADAAAIASVIATVASKSQQSKSQGTPSTTQQTTNAEPIIIEAATTSGFTLPDGAINLTVAAQNNMVSTESSPAVMANWFVQAGAFGSSTNANSYASTLKQQLSETVTIHFDGQYYRVLIGPYMSSDVAATQAQQLGNVLGKKLVPYQVR